MSSDTSQLTFNASVTFCFIFQTSVRTAVPVCSETGEQFRATRPRLRQCGAHVLCQLVVLHQLSVDTLPRHFVLHQASLHHCAQLLLLRHLTLQALNLLTVLQSELDESG